MESAAFKAVFLYELTQLFSRFNNAVNENLLIIKTFVENVIAVEKNRYVH